MDREGYTREDFSEAEHERNHERSLLENIEAVPIDRALLSDEHIANFGARLREARQRLKTAEQSLDAILTWSMGEAQAMNDTLQRKTLAVSDAQTALERAIAELDEYRHHVLSGKAS